MPKKVDINIRHVTRVEGHGNIRVRATDGTIEEAQWEVPEAPRFFEAMVCGRGFRDIQTIVSRICGICSVTHSLAALKALEDALQVQVSEQTQKLRILAHYGEQLESHSLHLGYLVAPDLLGQKSVLPLVESHTDLVKTIIAIHRVGNLMMERLSGRKTHPVRLVPGGFSMLPSMVDLQELKQQLEQTLPRLDLLAEAVAGLADGFPRFERDTEYVALMQPGSYPFYFGAIGSSDIDQQTPVRDFESVANEYVTPHSTAKWARWHRDSYMVGALARFNLNSEQLLPPAKVVAKALGLEKGCCNPYWNNLAQLVELVHIAHWAIQLLEELLVEGIRTEVPKVEPRAGVGVGAVEAPRGVLFHKYELDDNGHCVAANMCIPTNQNHANIQQDLEALLPQIIHQEQDEIRRQLEMLVRAYDPCISCSTHFLKVEFV